MSNSNLPKRASFQVVEQADVVIVATKPPLVPKVLTEINPVQYGNLPKNIMRIPYS